MGPAYQDDDRESSNSDNFAPAAHLRLEREAEGWFAAYALPYDPFVAVLPLICWAVLDGAELVGLVSDGGQIVPAATATDGELVDYYKQGMAEPLIGAIVTRATRRGRELHSAHFTPAPAPAEPALPPRPRRQRPRPRRAPARE